MAKSSINFKKASGHSSAHNLRIDEPSYLLPFEYRLENEYWQNSKSDKELFELELKNSKPKGGPKPKLENSRWEAVLNLNADHTLEDVKKVAEHIAKKFNITPTEITIHRDEGHLENGKPKYNFHAHLNFLTYKDGKQNWRKEFIKPALLSELQTDVAKILGMERGKVNSKSKRLDHRQYKAVQKEMQYNFREMQKRITALEHLTTEQKKDLHRLNSKARKDDTKIQELERKLETTKKSYIKAFREILPPAKNEVEVVEYVKTLKIERESTNALKTEVSTLKEEKSSLRLFVSDLKLQIKELMQQLQEYSQKIFRLEGKNKELERENEALKSQVSELSKEQLKSKTPSFSSPPIKTHAEHAPSASAASLEDLLNELEDVQAQKNAGERIKDLMNDLDEVKRLKI